jgi:methyl-accepting chemotaxis protein
MAKDADAVSESIAGVAAISQESAAGAEELSATVEEVGNAARELSTLSAELRSIVANFKYEQSGGHLRLAA